MKMRRTQVWINGDQNCDFRKKLEWNEHLMLPKQVLRESKKAHITTTTVMHRVICYLVI